MAELAPNLPTREQALADGMGHYALIENVYEPEPRPDGTTIDGDFLGTIIKVFRLGEKPEDDSRQYAAFAYAHLEGDKLAARGLSLIRRRSGRLTLEDYATRMDRQMKSASEALATYERRSEA